MAMSDELENSGKLVVRPEQVGSMEDSRGARVDSNKLDKAVSKKSDVQEEEVTTGGFRESNGDRESMRASDTTESGTARCENADPFESIEAHDHHQFEEKEFKAKITCGNRLIGYRKYKVLSFDTNSIKGNEVTSGGTEFIGLDGLDSAHKLKVIFHKMGTLLQTCLQKTTLFLIKWALPLQPCSSVSKMKVREKAKVLLQ